MQLVWTSLKELLDNERYYEFCGLNGREFTGVTDQFHKGFIENDRMYIYMIYALND